MGVGPIGGHASHTATALLLVDTFSVADTGKMSGQAQCTVHPPSTTKVCPVMYPSLPDAKTATTSAISSG
jgi:hypothetical protein